MAKPPWTFIPTAVLDAEKRAEAAKAFGDAERAKLARLWGDSARHRMGEILRQQGLQMPTGAAVGQQMMGGGTMVPAVAAPPADNSLDLSGVGSAIGGVASGIGNQLQGQFGPMLAGLQLPNQIVQAGMSDQMTNPSPMLTDVLPGVGLLARGGRAVASGTRSAAGVSPSPAADPVSQVKSFLDNLQTGLDTAGQPYRSAVDSAAQSAGGAVENVTGSGLAGGVASAGVNLMGNAITDPTMLFGGGEAAPRAVKEIERLVVSDPVQATVRLLQDAVAQPGVQEHMRMLKELHTGQEGALHLPGRGTPPVIRSPAIAKVVKMYEQGAPKPGLPLSEIANEHARNFIHAWTDRGVDLNRWQQSIAKEIGRPLSAREMVSELTRLNPDKAAEVHLQEGLKPALNMVGPEDEKLLDAYLTLHDNVDVARAMGEKAATAATKGLKATTPAQARAVAELHQTVKTETEQARKFSGDMTLAESEQGLSDFPSEVLPDQMQKIERSAKIVWKMSDTLLKRMNDSGLINDDLYNTLSKRYPHYVPTRILDYMKEPTNLPLGKSLSISDKGLRTNTLAGTKRARENPLASMVRAAYDVEAHARKNDAFNAFVRLRDLSPDMREAIKEVKTTYTPTRDEKAVTGFVGGVRRTFVMPKDLAAVVEIEAIGNAPPFLTTLMGVYRALLTSRNPGFLAGNSVNDAFTYTIRTASKEGGPQHIPSIVVDLARAYADAFSGILSGTFHGDTAKFLKGGGGQSGFFQGTEGQARQGLADLRNQGNLIVVNNAGDLARLVRDIVTLKPVEKIGERIELAPRVAAYRRGLKAGESNLQAVISGRNVTIDFSMGGSWAKFINQFIPFFNVAFQAGAIPVRTFRENPKGFIGTAATLLVAPIVSAEAWNRSDPQRAKDYADVPQYIKDQGVVIMLPVTAATDVQGERRPQFVLLRTREYAAISTLARAIAERVIGSDDPRAWQSLAEGMVTSAAPLQWTGATDAFSSLTPPVISTGMQLSTNRDFFRNRDIATTRNDENASALSGAVAGAIGARPSQVEFAGRDLGGGVATVLSSASNAIAGRPRGNSLQDIPVVGQTIGRFVRGDVGETLHRAQIEGLTPEAESALTQLGVKWRPVPMARTFLDVDLTRDEQTRIQKLADQRTSELVLRASHSKAFQAAAPAEREKALRAMIAEARHGAALEIANQIPDFVDRRRAAKKAS